MSELIPKIISIGSATPEYCFDQMTILEFMVQTSELEAADAHKLEYVYKVSGIEQRYSVLEDFGLQNGDYPFFGKIENPETYPTVNKRMLLYKEKAAPLVYKAIQDCIKNIPDFENASITHLITVSCTGMYAPGLDIDIINAFGFNSTTERTCINFMGCYAAFNALKAAYHICRSVPNASVLIADVELCTIHFQKSKSWDSLISNALFGDGAAACIVTNKKSNVPVALIPHKFHCDIIPQGADEMSWNISDYGFEMVLTSYVPHLIKSGIKDFVQSLYQGYQSDMRPDFYAVHPGGRKILDVLKQSLDIAPNALDKSYDVLKNYGNMSSVTIFFVLKQWMETMDETAQGKNLLCMAFGPGLTIESSLMSVEILSEKEIVKNSEEQKLHA